MRRLAAEIKTLAGEGADLVAPAALDSRSVASSRLRDIEFRLEVLQRQLRVLQIKNTVSLAPPPPEPAPTDISSNVLSFEYEESEKKADQLTLTLRNDDLSYFDSPLFEKGTTLLVGWGYVGALAPMREVLVQKVTGARVLKLVAQSKSVLMNKKTRVRVFENKTRSEIARLLAEENGYGAALQDIEATDIRKGAINQAAQTDAQFLKRLADQEGFEFYVDFDGFHWHRRRFNQKPLRVLQYFLPPDVGDIVDFNIENDVTAKPGAVIVKGRNPLDKKGISVTADNTNTKRDTLAPVLMLLDTRTGQKTPKTIVTTAEETRTTSETTAAGAKKEADAIYRRTQQTAVQLTMSLVGDPYLVAKSVVEVRGLGKRLSGKYYISEIKHTLGASYAMSVKAKTDGVHTGAVPSKGAPNTTQANAADVGALTTTYVLDERTGQKVAVFKDTRGRQQGGAA